MRSRAAPGPLRRVGYQSRSHRVQFDVAEAAQQVVLIHDIRGEAALPEMAAPVFAEIDEPCVSTVRLSDCRCQGFLALGNDDKVNVIWHEAVAPDLNGVACAPPVDQVEVGLVVVIGKEGLLPTIAALGDVVRKTGGYSSGYPCHKEDDELDGVVMSIDELWGHLTYIDEPEAD